MLQQTVVATVEPYFNRFIARFPDVSALAAAERRRRDGAVVGARLLRARPQPAARGGGDRGRPRRRGAGRPSERCGRCPGIGPYTAAAVAAIAFGARTFALDGNAARVMARLGRERGSIDRPATRAALHARGRRRFRAGAPATSRRR